MLRSHPPFTLSVAGPFMLLVALPDPDNSSPITYPWEGGKLLAHSPDYDEIVVTRDDYEENGHCICEDNFDI